MDRDSSRTDDLQRFLDPGYLDLEEMLDALDFEVVPSGGLFGRQGIELRKCRAGGRKLAITISGGGASGAYSAGLLEVLLDRLERRGIDVGIFVGTSSGAVNGYGAFLEKLGKGNPQFHAEPSIRQPFESYIASVWSYLDRDGKASRWVVGRRSWIVRLASRGLASGWSRAGLAALIATALILLVPNLLLPIALLAARSGDLADSAPVLFGWAVGSAATLGTALCLAVRVFRNSLFRDLPLLRLLANTGPGGDVRGYPRTSRAQASDQARILSREVAREWYGRRAELPEFVITSTDITAGRECLFTLVGPATYAQLVRREWMAVQFDSVLGATRDYCAEVDALFTLPENLVRSVLASSAVPGAFPTQRISIYRHGSDRAARHHFVDGGVLNNSPVHVAIDAGATHVISLETLPFEKRDPLADDDRGGRGYLLLEAALAAFTTVLERATDEDVRRTASWNRFLIRRPSGLGPGQRKESRSCRERRVVPIYRIAPREPLAGTVEFDGRYEGGKRADTLRDMLRRGVRDMLGRNVWPATTRYEPGWSDPEAEQQVSLKAAES